MIQLNPQTMGNPDLDIRYALPDLLAERSNGMIKDDGYDYVGDPLVMMLFLEVSDVEKASALIMDVVENVRVLDNDLRSAAVVAVQDGATTRVVYPAAYAGPFSLV
jgi:hypothetical protein